MPRTEAEKQRRAALEKWLVKIDPNAASYFRNAEKGLDAAEQADPNNPELKKTIAAMREADLAGARQEYAREEKAKTDQAKAAKELLDWEQKSGQSIKALQVLMDGIIMLGDEQFLKAHNSSQELKPSGEPTIDKLLDQVNQVFKLWMDTDKLDQALALWQKTQPVILAILAEGEKHFDSPGFANARAAAGRIGKYLGVRMAYKESDELARKMDTPDVGEALDLRELKKLEPVMLNWQQIVKNAGRFGVEGGKIKQMAKVLDIYFSVDDLREKLEAFKKAGLSDKIRTVADLTEYIGETSTEATKAYYEAAKVLAEKAGQKEAAEAIETKIAALSKVAKVLAVYEFAKSVKELIEAIDKQDWHAVAAASFGVVSSGIGVAETVGVIGGGTAAGAAGGGFLSAPLQSAKAMGGTGGMLTVYAFLIWTEVDTIMGVAELVAWAKLDRAFRATKKMVEDTRKIEPLGKKMAAAAQLLVETNSASTDAVEAGKYEIYRQQATDLAGRVDDAITALGVNNVFRSGDLDAVGGYPQLIVALGSPALNALRGSASSDPLSVSDRFKTVLLGIKAMIKKGDELYGEAG